MFSLLPSAPARHGVLPGFRLTFGFTIFYVSLFVILPLAALVWKATGIGLDGFIRTVQNARVLAAFRVTFGISLLAAATDMVVGLLLAWVLVRYHFPGRRLLDAAIDLPIALPTAVAGIALTELYANTGWLGAPLEALGIHVAFTPIGIFVALAFVGLPFVVRSVEPVLADLERDTEEAAATLGATPWQIFRYVIFPAVLPAVLTGFTLAFGRAIGEYGSVIFIAGNKPGISEIVPLLIVVQLEQYNYVGAAVLGSLMLFMAFAIMFTINAIQYLSNRRFGS